MRIATSFLQLRVQFDGVWSERDDWGAVKVRYSPLEEPRYFNLAVGDRWVLRNAPLFPAQFPSPPIETLFYFDLGIASGVSADAIALATSVAPVPIAAPPSVYVYARLAPAVESYWTDFEEEPFPPLGKPPETYTGGALRGVVFCRRDYPNQPCGKNECAPAAVSNSMKWLNDKYHLQIDPSKLTIDYWKSPLGWTPAGVDHGDWAKAKKKFVDDKKNDLPIDSDWETLGHAAHVLEEFKRGQAVEVDIGSHVAAVICMSVDDDKHYHLMAASDAAQNGQQAAGNPVSQQIEISPNGDVISGPPWARGQRVNNFVIQCPHQNKFK